MRCIDCTEPATHRGRGKNHHQDYGKRASVHARRARRAVLVRVFSGPLGSVLSSVPVVVPAVPGAVRSSSRTWWT